MSRALLLLGLLALALSAEAMGVTTCAPDCKDDLKFFCVSHYDTGCKPSWWRTKPDCMRLPAKRTRRVMPSPCQYKCIKHAFNFEKWRVERKRVKLSKYCQKQWKVYGFAAPDKCQKC